MIMGTVLSKEAATNLNGILEEEGYAAVLKHLAFFARREMEIVYGDKVASLLVSLANKLIRGEEVRGSLRGGRIRK